VEYIVATIGYLSAVENFIITNLELIRSLSIVILPVISAYSAYTVARHQIKASEADREKAERQIVHTENADQTTAMTAQFRAVMDGYQARVEDLKSEVFNLRTEVTSLRKALDRQRVMCGGCPKLPKLYTDDDDHAPATPAAAS